MATGFGLKPVRKLNGGEIRSNTYYVPSTDSTAIAVGDVVELVNAMDAAGLVKVVKRLAADTNLPVGVVTGIVPDGSSFTSTMRAASTARYLLVCDDPDVILQGQEDAVGGSVTAAAIGECQNIEIITAAASSSQEVSGTMLDSSTATTSACNYKLIGVSRVPGQAAAMSGGAILEVIALKHALKTTDSRS